MYCPAGNRQDERLELLALIASCPLATLITHGPQGLMANLIPMQVGQSANGEGVLHAHLARANPQCAELAAGAEVLVLFQGPQAYITPAWYASKAQHGKAVPTWNYAMVQVRGAARVIDDREWIRAQVTALTQQQEQAFDHPWQVADAPEAYIDAMLGALCGVEIAMTTVEGKWKLGQNRPPADRQSLLAGLEAAGHQALHALSVHHFAAKGDDVK